MCLFVSTSYYSEDWGWGLELAFFFFFDQNNSESKFPQILHLMDCL